MLKKSLLLQSLSLALLLSGPMLAMEKPEPATNTANAQLMAALQSGNIAQLQQGLRVLIQHL